jgi:carbon monoxide dehydrogenase subunit G
VRLDHQFTVPAPVDEVWKAVIDPERVTPCMPGAGLTEVEGDTFKGTVKVKLGPISLLYKGTGEFLEKDEAARKVVIKAAGKDSRGAGTAAATVTLTLTGEGGSTKGSVATDLSVTGKPAQFGRGLIAEVSGKILDSFATCLAEELGTPGAAEGSSPALETGSAPQPKPDAGEPAAAPAAPAAATPARTSVRPAAEPEPIDLFDYAGGSVLKRLAPVLAGAAAVLVVLGIIRAFRR